MFLSVSSSVGKVSVVCEKKQRFGKKLIPRRAYPTMSLLIQIWIVATVRNASKQAVMRSHRTAKHRSFFWNQANVHSA
jgi:hypothetical protein